MASKFHKESASNIKVNVKFWIIKTEIVYSNNILFTMSKIYFVLQCTGEMSSLLLFALVLKM